MLSHPIGVGYDEIGYLIPKAESDKEPPWLRNSANPWYGQINSVGPDAAGLGTLIRQEGK